MSLLSAPREPSPLATEAPFSIPHCVVECASDWLIEAARVLCGFPDERSGHAERGLPLRSPGGRPAVLPPPSISAAFGARLRPPPPPRRAHRSDSALRSKGSRLTELCHIPLTRDGNTEAPPGRSDSRAAGIVSTTRTKARWRCAGRG